jgi:hypothetical protein
LLALAAVVAVHLTCEENVERGEGANGWMREDVVAEEREREAAEQR